MVELHYEHRMRLKFNQDSMRSTFQELKKAIDDNDDHGIYKGIGEMLLWVCTTDTWHLKNNHSNYKKRRAKDEDGALLKGMLHAFNCFKHNMDFFQIHHKKGGLEIDENGMEFPFEIKEITVHWMAAGEVLTGEYENQRENYVKHLEGKEVISTFEQVLSFLNKEFQNIVFQ